VQLDGGLRDTLFREEGGYLETLITLKLDDLTHLLVFNEGTIAGKFLLESLQKFLSIVFLGQSLQRGQSLPPIPLLDTNMDVVLLRTDVVVRPKRVSLIGKGIEGIEVLHAHAIERRVQK